MSLFVLLLGTGHGTAPWDSLKHRLWSSGSEGDGSAKSGGRLEELIEVMCRGVCRQHSKICPQQQQAS